MPSRKSTRITLVRHGQTDYNAEKRWQGQIDIPLNDLGRSQASQLMPVISQQQWTAIYSSDLLRCVETLTTAMGQADLQYKQEELLREMDFGQCEGLTYDEIVAMGFGDVFDAFQQDPRTFAMPGGETFAQVMQRFQKWTQVTGPTWSDGDNILACCHGGTIRAALALTDQAGSWQKFSIANCSRTVVELVQDGSKQSLRAIDIGIENPTA